MIDLTHAYLICIPHHVFLYVYVVTVLLVCHGKKLTVSALKTSSIIFTCSTSAQIRSETFIASFPNLRPATVLGSEILACNGVGVTFALT